LQDIEASGEITKQREHGPEADDKKADEEPTVGLTAGVVGDVEELLVH